jgi:hypothetical protein
MQGYYGQCPYTISKKQRFIEVTFVNAFCGLIHLDGCCVEESELKKQGEKLWMARKYQAHSFLHRQVRSALIDHALRRELLSVSQSLEVIKYRQERNYAAYCSHCK